MLTIQGKFIAFLVGKDIKGAINGASDGIISLKEIIGLLYSSR